MRRNTLGANHTGEDASRAARQTSACTVLSAGQMKCIVGSGSFVYECEMDIMSAMAAPCLQVSRLTGSTTGATQPERARLAWPHLITTTGRTPASPCAGGASPPSGSTAWSERSLSGSLWSITVLLRQGLRSADGSAEVGQQREVGGAARRKDQCVSSWLAPIQRTALEAAGLDRIDQNF